jgi:hypothetical protein
MVSIPHPGRRVRLLMLTYGLIVLFWLSPEESQVWPVALLGLGVSLLGVGVTLMNRMGGRTIPASYVAPGAALVGIIVGLGASIAVTFLMFFKNALHAHVYPDFPLPVMLAMLERAPVWGLAGLLAGLGLGLAWLGWGRATSNG